jgi:hypothetical protein
MCTDKENNSSSNNNDSSIGDHFYCLVLCRLSSIPVLSFIVFVEVEGPMLVELQLCVFLTSALDGDE